MPGSTVPAGRHRFSSYTMVLPVNNEETRVARALAYYLPFAPVVVIDNFSRDGSAAIAREGGVEVVQHRNTGTIQTPEWMRFVSALLPTDHFVLLSCSEFLPAALLARFDDIARARSADVVRCARRTFTCGEEIPLWGWRSAQGYRILLAERFFDRTGLDFDRVVIHHPFLPLDPGRTLTLPDEERFTIVHLRDSDAASLVVKHAEYAAVEARHRVEHGRRSGIGLLFRSCAYELVNLLRAGPRHWSRLALREVWARLVMHTVTCWAAWEQRSGATLEASRRRSDALWDALARGSSDPADPPGSGAPAPVPGNRTATDALR